MKQQGKYAFKPTDVHFGNEMPFYMENEKIDNAIDWLITKSLPVMDHTISSQYLGTKYPPINGAQ
ncbi:MAG: hypothetical protein ACTSRC_12330 [Candidatus Helarchaeota archaeon]